MDNTNLTYIDFFSGCGGLSLGLGLANWNGIFAIEKDPMAYSSFDHNLVDQNAPYQHFKRLVRRRPTAAVVINLVLFALSVAYMVYNSYTPFLYAKF